MRMVIVATAALVASAAAAQVAPGQAAPPRAAHGSPEKPQTPDEFDATWVVAPDADRASAAEARPRGGLELSPLRLHRLSPDRKDVPVTLSTTHFGDWTVACESRGAEKACFASAYNDANGKDARLKVKFGPAAVEDPPAPPVDDKARAKGAPEARHAARPARPQPHYVVNFEAPPGLDASPGFVVDAPAARGILDATPGCDAAACRATIEVTAALAPIMPLVATAPGERDGIRVLAAVNGQPIMWRLTTNGLAEAFAKVRAETDPPEEAAPLVAMSLARPKVATGPVATGVRLGTSPLALPGGPATKAPAGADPSTRGAATPEASAPATSAAVEVAAGAVTATVAAAAPVAAAASREAVVRHARARVARRAPEPRRQATVGHAAKTRSVARSGHFVPGT